MPSVRLIQTHISDVETQTERVESTLEALHLHLSASDFVVLPEFWHCGAFNLEAIRQGSVSANNEIFAQLSALAREYETWLHAGTFAIRNENGDVTNSAMVYAPTGELAARYDKQYLFGFADGERTVISAGESEVVLETQLGSTGLATCYDLRFPELFRQLLDLGAESVLISASWPTARIEHWQTLTTARAIENQSFVIACNARGESGGVELGGQSMVIDPWGRIVGQASATDEYLDVNIDIQLVGEVRSSFPVLKDRKLS